MCILLRLGLLSVPCLHIYEAVTYIKLHTTENINSTLNYNSRIKKKFTFQHNRSLFEKVPKYSSAQSITKQINVNRLKQYLIVSVFFCLSTVFKAWMSLLISLALTNTFSPPLFSLNGTFHQLVICWSLWWHVWQLPTPATR